MMIDPISGFAPAEWQMNVGEVILARADKKPLLDRQFDLLHDYNHLILEFFGDDPSIGRAHMTSKHFARFWKQSAENDARYATIPSPLSC
jgi:hypothetical protein